MWVHPVKSSNLAERLRQRIRQEGPISFHDWMKAALYDREKGYYCRGNRARWGRVGDYRTSPERSVLFGATFARYFAGLYQKLGSPAKWTILEAGAGAADFAFTILQTFQKRFPEIFRATRYIIDEISPDSRSRAQQQLAPFGKLVEFNRLPHLEPVTIGIIFANELFDAFPVHRVIRQGDQFREFYVSLNDAGDFVWTTGPLSQLELVGYLEDIGVKIKDAQILEINADLNSWLGQAASALRKGYLVTVDYGAEADELYNSSDRPEGTLRAFRGHRFSDNLLASPGQQDITSTVDWTLIQRLGEKLGFYTTQFERQDRFLLKAGLLEQLELMLNESRDEGQKAQLRAGAREMILPVAMGASYHVLVQKKGDLELDWFQNSKPKGDRLIDLSHTIEDGMITYKGLPPPVISDHFSRQASRAFYEEGTEFQIGRIEMIGNTGTYLDSPFHRYPDATDLARLQLRSVANIDGIVVRCATKGLLVPDQERSARAITPVALEHLDVAGKAVLFHTGWDARWRREEYSDGTHPFLSQGAADYLAQAGAALVGIDSYNVDDTGDGRRPAHSILLAHGIPIVEHLCGLSELPDSGFQFFAVPAKVKGFGTFPVRAFALVRE